jgi:hypothetical protein
LTQRKILEEQLAAVEGRMAKLLDVPEGKVRMGMRWDVLDQLFHNGGGCDSMQMQDEKVKTWKYVWRKFIRSPIDKYPGEMALI